MSQESVDLEELRGRLLGSTPLTQAECRAALTAILAGAWGEAEAADFLVGCQQRGETTDELFAATKVLRERMTPFGARVAGLVDTCGTGGDGAGTFNISTAAALVVAGCGVPVAKHGNRGFSSRSGSADVLAELGVKPAAEPAAARRCLEAAGLCFLFAPLWHPAVRVVQPVRQRLKQRTIFNLLGPLCNPAGVDHQVLGVGFRTQVNAMGRTLRELGTKGSVIVSGADGLDEVTLADATDAWVVQTEGVVHHRWTPETFGLAPASRADWQVDGPVESAARILAILAGEKGPSRDIVLANAAVALWICRRCTTLADGVALAANAIDTGRAAKVVERYRGAVEIAA